MRSTIVAAMVVAATLIVGLPAAAQVTHTDVPGILNFSPIYNAEALPDPIAVAIWTSAPNFRS